MSQLRIDKRRGISKPVTESEIEAYRKHAQERRETNVVNAREILSRNGIGWIEFASDDEPVFMINWAGFTTRYRPMCGKWFDRQGVERYGCRNLVRYLKGEVK